MSGYDGEERRQGPSVHTLDRRLALLEAAVKALKAEVHSINNNITRVVWVVLGAILAAFLDFALKGGLH
jgi:hypothetical protein